VETNPYEYDSTVPWIPQQNQLHEGRYVSAHPSQQPSALQNQRLQQRGGDQKRKSPERMPKAQALDLVRVYKKRLVVASLVVFGLLSGLVAYHQVGTTTNQVQSGPSQVAPGTQPSSGGFFDQQGGSNFGSSNPWQPPVTGSRVS